MKKTSLIVGFLALVLVLLLSSILAVGASVKIGNRMFCGSEFNVKAYVEEGDLHILMDLPYAMKVFPFYQGKLLLLPNREDMYNFFPAGLHEITLEKAGYLGPQEIVVLAGCFDIVKVDFNDTCSSYLSVADIEQNGLWRYGHKVWVGETKIPARICSPIKPVSTPSYEPYQCYQNCPRGCSLPWCWAWRPISP